MFALGSPVFAFEPYVPVRERPLEKLALNPGLSIREALAARVRGLGLTASGASK